MDARQGRGPDCGVWLGGVLGGLIGLAVALWMVAPGGPVGAGLGRALATREAERRLAAAPARALQAPTATQTAQDGRAGAMPWVEPLIAPTGDSTQAAPSSTPAPPTATATPIPPTATPTLTPTPTATLTPTSTPTLCPCESGAGLNCDSFAGEGAAQACYAHCLQATGLDVHGLDGEGDGLACE